MAICTNNVREWEPRWRGMLPVDEIFDVVVDSAFVGTRKPEPRIYELTLERLGVTADAALLIDDIEINCEAARELGMGAVWFPRPNRRWPRPKPRWRPRPSRAFPGMRWRLRLMLVGGVLTGIIVVLLATRGGEDAAQPIAKAPAKLDPLPSALTISLPAQATGRRVPDGFLGFSFEFSAVRAYTGSDVTDVNPVFEQLIRNLSPGQDPVLRIGGDSTDLSYAPAPGVRPPPYVNYALTPSWMATTSALAHQLGARMIMGLNLAANDPKLAAAEARDDIRAFGRASLEALEIGNEPNIYNRLTVDHTLLGIALHARPRSFGYPAFRRQFRAVARAAPRVELAGPALAVGPTAQRGSWIATMPDFLRRDPRVRIMTVHRYPLRNCYVPPTSPQFPTVAHLLARYSTAGLASSLHPWLQVAHRQHRRLRVDELNSVACRGQTGISDTFASSLWVTDALFSLLHAGIDGVNIHTLPGAAYELFAFTQSGDRWSGAVRPVYYGLQLFAQAAPPGSRLLALPGLGGGSSVLSAWATRDLQGIERVVLIDKDPLRAETVTLRPPAGVPGGATLERMQAPSLRANSGVTLGGRTYGPHHHRPAGPGDHRRPDAQCSRELHRHRAGRQRGARDAAAGDARTPLSARAAEPGPGWLVLDPEAVPAVQLQALARQRRAPFAREPRQNRVEGLLLADTGLEGLLAAEPGGDLQRFPAVIAQRWEHVDEKFLVGQRVAHLQRHVPGRQQRQVVFVEVGDRLGVMRPELGLRNLIHPCAHHLTEDLATRFTTNRVGDHPDGILRFDEAQGHGSSD